MKYQPTTGSDPAEALGAYSGYRIRIVVRRDPGSERLLPAVSFRGSESMPEQPVPAEGRAFDCLEEAFDAGYAQAVAWIDRLDEAGA